jgi:hypothetical protein
MRCLVAMFALALAACSETITSNPAGTRLMYPITAEEADQVLGQAMLATFPGSTILPVTLPNKGYVVTIRFLIDQHDIIGTAVPTDGRQSNGVTIRGFSFVVSNTGTLPISASGFSRTLFDDIHKRAAAIRAPLPAI